MKKIILTGVIALLASVYSFSQSSSEDFRSKLHFGVKAGINYSNVYNESGEKFVADPKLGLAAGVFLSIPIGKYIGIQPEVLLSQKGFSATGVILGGTYSFTRTTTYIDVPLLFAIKPAEFLSIYAGPQYSYLIKQKDAFETAQSSIEQEQEFENENIRKNILGVTGGIDINIRKIIVAARVGWDIQKNNGDGTSATPNYKNVWYQLMVGYRF